MHLRTPHYQFLNHFYPMEFADCVPVKVTLAGFVNSRGHFSLRRRPPHSELASRRAGGRFRASPPVAAVREPQTSVARCVSAWLSEPLQPTYRPAGGRSGSACTPHGANTAGTGLHRSCPTQLSTFQPAVHLQDLFLTESPSSISVLLLLSSLFAFHVKQLRCRPALLTAYKPKFGP